MEIYIAVLFRVLASFFMKLGAMNMEDYTIGSLLYNVPYYVALFALLLQAMVWQKALKQYSLSFAYMLTSLFYPAILLLSYFYFEEVITLSNIFGVALILIGIAIVTKVKSHG